MKGGSEWFNSGKCMVTVHRETKDTNEAQLIFGKIKPRSVGQVGTATVFLDLNNFIYYELTEDGRRKYANRGGKSKIVEEKVPNIEFNNNFTSTKKLQDETEEPF